MSAPNGSDPIDRLRAADPVGPDDVPDASLARVSARVQEHIMSDVQHAAPVNRRRLSFAQLGGLGVVGALAVALTVAGGSAFGPQQPGPVAVDPSSDPAGGGGLASCIVYDPAILPTFEIVFDGTVTAIEGDQVTFDVGTAWKGVGRSVTLTAPDAGVALVGPIPDFAVGGRYLVTAAGSTINACGYTLEYDPATAATWAAAFAG
jgi:hypothetical protein